MSEKDIYTSKLDALEKKVVRNTIRNTRDMALKHPKGADGLTDRQRIFVEIYVANEGRLTPTECARQAGYKKERAATTASELLNIDKYPKVVSEVRKKRNEIYETHKVEMNKHVTELARLREKALHDKSHSAAINAERLRGQAAGLYVERKEIRTGSIDDMSRDDVLKQLKELGLDGSFKKEGHKTVLSVEEESNSKGPKDITEVSSESSEGQEKV
mgnify:FL=1